MKDHLVIVAQSDAVSRNYEGMGQAVLVEGMRHWAVPFTQDDVDLTKADWQKDVKAWLVEERDSAALVSHITKLHAGVEVHVYKLTGVAIRPAGEIVVKEVTKDGVLPK